MRGDPDPNRGAIVSETDNKKLLLLVDDAPANIQIANAILKDDYRVRIATSGAKALELVKTRPVPDLILLDVGMPEMDGYEVCQRLKADPETRDIPVIFLTGKTEAEDETKGFAVGAVDYIHKPFLPAIVQARVHTHLALREAREQVAHQLAEIQKELAMARQMQLAILPQQAPRVEGVEIAARYVPMTSVAGDLYDFLPVDEKRFGVLIADVSGHGVPAALCASMLKMAFASQAAHAADPARVLTELNQALCGKLDFHFITAAYLFVDAEKGTIDYAGAGHPPILFGGGSGSAPRALQQNGLLLGMFPAAKYSAMRIPMAPGDRCVLYTDGISEARNRKGDEFGLDGLEALLNRSPDLPSNAFADRVLEAVKAWTERSPAEGHDDDITLLVMRATQSGGAAETKA
jgi:serine phosphatase RsbU (regulator of sigma subunit)